MDAVDEAVEGGEEEKDQVELKSSEELERCDRTRLDEFRMVSTRNKRLVIDSFGSRRLIGQRTN